ncbi:hypothetical protein P3342_011917 [Pyrenophora teres f. teres]|nr:hypothetical protein P3342_011917 [Pyrenophora teres f. teres]
MEIHLSPLELAAHADDIDTFNALPRPLPDNRRAGFYKVLFQALKGCSVSVLRWLLENDAVGKEGLVEMAVSKSSPSLSDMKMIHWLRSESKMRWTWSAE